MDAAFEENVFVTWIFSYLEALSAGSCCTDM